MTKEQRVKFIIQRLKNQYPKPRTALRYQTPFQLLVAVILSAQCTDAKVNEVTKPLFLRYRTARDFAAIPLSKLQTIVKPTGFYRMKARAILETSKMVAERYGNCLPQTIEGMLTLRGVARKTANVVMGELTGKTEGIAVDTHVKRLSLRLGLTKNEDPVKVEDDLMAIVSKPDWVRFPLFLIFHGRNVCEAKKPTCDQCVLNTQCPSAFRFPHFSRHPSR
jgi:endonuclease-3